MRATSIMSTSTWIRKGLDVARLPRVKLNNIQDLPGANKKVKTSLSPLQLRSGTNSSSCAPIRIIFF